MEKRNRKNVGERVEVMWVRKGYVRSVGGCVRICVNLKGWWCVLNEGKGLSKEEEGMKETKENRGSLA